MRTESNFFKWFRFCSQTDADFGTSTTVTVDPSSSRGCTDFTDLVVDDSVALEGNQSFTIVVGSSTAMVNIIDDDGKIFNFSLTEYFHPVYYT